jgi:hypothetical protein
MAMLNNQRVNELIVGVGSWPRGDFLTIACPKSTPFQDAWVDVKMQAMLDIGIIAIALTNGKRMLPSPSQWDYVSWAPTF